MDDERTRREAVRANALRRARRVKRLVAGGAVALTGVFSAVAAHAFPANRTDHGSGASAATRRQGEHDAARSAKRDASRAVRHARTHHTTHRHASGVPAPPAAAPQASSSDTGVVSGGS